MVGERFDNGAVDLHLRFHSAPRVDLCLGVVANVFSCNRVLIRRWLNDSRCHTMALHHASLRDGTGSCIAREMSTWRQWRNPEGRPQTEKYSARVPKCGSTMSTRSERKSDRNREIEGQQGRRNGDYGTDETR